MSAENQRVASSSSSNRGSPEIRSASSSSDGSAPIDAMNDRFEQCSIARSSSGSDSGINNGSKKIVHKWEGQKFATRPGYVTLSSSKPTKVYSNHYALNFLHDEILFTLYNLEVFEVADRGGRPARGGGRGGRMGPQRGNKQIIKREIVAPLFWNLCNAYPEVFLTDTFQVDGHKVPRNLVFNDVNLLYVMGTDGLPQMEAGQRCFTLIQDGKRPKKYELLLKNVGVQSATLKPGALKEQRDNVITLFDLVLSQRVRCGLHMDSRNFTTHKNNTFLIPTFDWNLDNPSSTNECVNIGSGLAAWTGLHSAIKINLQSQKASLLNVDLSHSLYYKSDINVLRICFEFLEKTRGKAFDDELVKRCIMSYSTKKRLEEKLKGLSVKANYMDRPQRYEIYGITDPKVTARNHYLKDENGLEMSIEEYFYRRYNIHLDFPMLPLAVLDKKNTKRAPRLMPLELLSLSEIPQKFKGQPQEEQLAYFIRETAILPMERKALIERLAGCSSEGIQQDGLGALAEQDPIMKHWGVGVDKKMLKVDATFLPRPQLEYPKLRHSKETDIFEAPAEGVWAVADPHCNGIRTALLPPGITAWMLVVVDPERSGTVDFHNFGFLMETIAEFGIDIYGSTKEPTFYFEWHFENSGTNKKDLQDEITNFKEACYTEEMAAKQRGELTEEQKINPCVLFLFPRKSPESYGLSKYICEVLVGVHHQGILLKNYKRCSGKLLACTTAHNMFFKINAKLGGTHYRIPPEGTHKNWNRVVNPKEPTLFIGVDVTHSASKDQQRRVEARIQAQSRDANRQGPTPQSVASIVGNIDIDCTQYRMSTRIQKKNEERLVNLTDELFTRIADFVSHSGVRPHHIVIYRDGVSETEFKRTFFEEKKAYDYALERIDPSGEYRPTLTYIVVTKRHHTRFFAANEGDTTREAKNLLPGLLVEKEVTTSEYFDFYLLSHNGPLGTSRPTHYYVLHDTWKPSAHFWQTITYALCHLYVRTPKSVSLPAPVFYAHLAAKRAADWLKAYELNYLREKHETEDTLIEKKKMATTPIIQGMLFC